MSVNISTDDMDRALHYCDSYSRLPTLIDLYPRAVRSGLKAEWRALMGREWSGCDNITKYLDALIWILPAQGPVTEMMTETELEAYQALPADMIVYRGAGKVNRWGASWSLDEQVARRFPTLNRYWQKHPMLYTARVQKNRILALKLDREEHEVITFSAEIVKALRISRMAV